MLLATLAGCGEKGEPDVSGPVEPALPEPPPIPEVTAAPAPPGAADLPRAGEDGMRFGYNDGLDAGSAKIGLLPGSGADTVRLRMNWRQIEPHPGQYDWSHFDALYTQLLGLGIRPLWYVMEAPCWAGDARIPCDPAANSAGAPGPEHAGDFAGFVAAVAQRYPESLGIEIGNEPNDPTFWPNGQDPIGYTNLLAQVAAAIDALGSQVPIVSGGLSPIAGPKPGEITWRTYLDAMLTHGAADYVDAIAFHPYVRRERGTDPGAAVGALVDKVGAFMAARGAAGEPLWITEVGLSTVARPPLSPDEQASGLVSILTEMQSRGIPVTIVHRLVDEVRADFPLEAGFGVIESDNGTRKPAYCAIAAWRGVPCAAG